MRGGINPGDCRFRPPDVGVADAWKDFRTSDGALTSPACVGLSPNQSAIGQRRWGVHTVRGGVDPGEHRFRSQSVGVVETRSD